MEEITNEKIIDQIIYIEQRAQELIQKGKDEQSEISQKINGLLEEKKKKYYDDANGEIEKIIKQESVFAEEKIIGMKKEHEEKLNAVKALAEANISKWVDEVYSYVIEPTDLAV
jgi:hypothetical protein